MIIKLTNAVDLFKGKSVLINTDYIISIFESELEGKPVTMVYAESKDTWQVEETVAEIFAMINGVNFMFDEIEK
jgi:hypothetical protein